MKKPIVLVIEDNSLMIEIFKLTMPFVEIISAQTKEEGRKILEKHLDDAFLVALDACVPGREANTQDLLKEILKKNFKGHIVSISGDPIYREEYLELGCTHACNKQNLQAFIRGLLNLPLVLI